MSHPEISVVVPSHDRPVRLRWLLDALGEQTLPRDRFEIVVAHDSRGEETDRLLDGHALTADGTLRVVRQPRGTAPPGANRNVGWRAARADTIAFTDDDCRPPPEWAERALAAARARPGAIVQGATRPDPDEAVLLHQAPHALSQHIDPPTPWGEACNIVYPRAVLDRLGGFPEDVLTGEDAELFARARAAGVPIEAVSEMLTYHAVATPRLLARLRWSWRWGDLPAAVRHEPALRAALPLRVFWKWAHAGLPLAVAGAALAHRRPAAALLVVPWALASRRRYGYGVRGLARSLSELPSRAAIDVVEMAALAAGSARHGTVML